MIERELRKRIDEAERSVGLNTGRDERLVIRHPERLDADAAYFIEEVAAKCKRAKRPGESLAELDNDELDAFEALMIRCGAMDDELAVPDDPVPDKATDYCGHFAAIGFNQQRAEERTAREAALHRVMAAAHVRRMNATGQKARRAVARTPKRPSPHGGQGTDGHGRHGRAHVLDEAHGKQAPTRRDQGRAPKGRTDRNAADRS